MGDIDLAGRHGRKDEGASETPGGGHWPLRFAPLVELSLLPPGGLTTEPGRPLQFHLADIDRRPLPPDPRVFAIFQIHATRAAA